MKAAWYERQGRADEVLAVGVQTDDAHVTVDTVVLATGGSIATYATGQAQPSIPFRELLHLERRRTRGRVVLLVPPAPA